MKTIGLIGGLSWESSAEYYRIINQTIQNELGGVSSAKILMHSFNFQEIKDLQFSGEWDQLSRIMINAASQLKNAGADFIVICSNTMHKMADDIAQGAGLPVLHIADPTGEEIQRQSISCVALLGTNFTMTHNFYKGRLRDKFKLEVLIPDENDRTIVHETIYNELVKGVIKPSSRDSFIKTIQKLVDNGAQGVILGCTEIMLLINQNHSPVPIFDTTTLHAKRAALLSIQP